MSCKDKRDQFIDICKGIGILCVYYGHTALYGTLPSRIVYSFHMPLFFLLSGMCFNPGKIENAMLLFRKVWRNLLLPYCIFVVIGKLLRWNVAISELFNNPGREIWRIIHGEGSFSIWFLVCLAVVQILMWLICRSNSAIVKGLLVLPGVIFLFGQGGSLSDDIVKRLPFMLASVPIGLLFFGIGMYGRTIIKGFVSVMAMALRLILFACLAIVVAFLFIINIQIPLETDVRRAIFVPQVLPSCILGLMLVFMAGCAVIKFHTVSAVFIAVGKRSLFLFALELPLDYLLSCITNGYVPNRMYLYDHSHWIEPVRFSSVMLLAWLCSYPVKLILARLRGQVIYCR